MEFSLARSGWRVTNLNSVHVITCTSSRVTESSISSRFDSFVAQFSCDREDVFVVSYGLAVIPPIVVRRS